MKSQPQIPRTGVGCRVYSILIPYCTMLNVSFFTSSVSLYDFLSIEGKIRQWDCILASFSIVCS